MADFVKTLVPPPDIKKIIEALAAKVAVNGKEFCEMIREHMKDNSKYQFLTKADNPYTPYWLQALSNEQAKLQMGESGQGEAEAAAG